MASHSVRAARVAGPGLRLRPPRLPLTKAMVLLIVAAGCGVVCVAALTVVMPRAALSLLIVQLVLALWLVRPDLGLAALWTTWLVISGARRWLDMALPGGGYDPLSIAPFAATAAVAAFELVGRRLPARAERVVLMALIGLAVGVPLGIRTPTALTFALFAYGSGVLAFVIGYAEGRRNEGTDTASRTLGPLLAPLAIYGIAQYLLPLPAWDEQWVRESGLTSIAVPGDIEHVRVFSTLNSPATFGAVLAIGLVAVLARDRLKPATSIAVLLALVALALTYVRMAVPALAVGLIAHAAASRWRAAPRLIGFAAVVVAAALALGATTQAGALVIKRVSTLGSLGTDTSANERQATAWQVLPEAASAPLGHGVGSSGEPSKLADQGAFGAAVDNGYLGLLYQLGPLGFVLVVMAMAAALGPLLTSRPASRALNARREVCVAIVAALLVLAMATDVFYGILGALLWFYLGHGLAVADATAVEAARTPAPRGRRRQSILIGPV